MIAVGIVSGIATAIIISMSILFRNRINSLTRARDSARERAKERQDLIDLEQVFYPAYKYREKLEDMDIFAGCNPKEAWRGVQLFRWNNEKLEKLSMRDEGPRWYTVDTDENQERLRFIVLNHLNAYWEYLEAQRFKLDTAFNRIAVDQPDVWRVSPQIVTESTPTNYERIQRAWVSEYLVRKGWSSEDGVTFRIRKDGQCTVEVYLRGNDVASRDGQFLSNTGTRCDHTLQLLLREVAYLEERKPCDVLLDIIRVPGKDRNIEKSLMDEAVSSTEPDDET